MRQCALLGDRVIRGHVRVIELHVLYVLCRHGGDVIAPQRNRWQILEQGLLSFLQGGGTFALVGLGEGIRKFLIELRALVIAVVGAVAVRGSGEYSGVR